MNGPEAGAKMMAGTRAKRIFKAIVGFVLGIPVVIIYLPLSCAKSCYENNEWPWEGFKI